MPTSLADWPKSSRKEACCCYALEAWFVTEGKGDQYLEKAAVVPYYLVVVLSILRASIQAGHVTLKGAF